MPMKALKPEDAGEMMNNEKPTVKMVTVTVEYSGVQVVSVLVRAPLMSVTGRKSCLQCKSSTNSIYSVLLE